MKNRLISEQLRQEQILRNGFCEETRCSGTSTGIAFSIIGEALMNPGKPISIYDHSNTDAGLQCVTEMIEWLVHKNELKYLTVNRVSGKECNLVYLVFE